MTIDHNVVATERHINSEIDKAEQLEALENVSCEVVSVVLNSEWTAQVEVEQGPLEPESQVVKTPIETDWVEAILEKYNELERVLDCLGLSGAAAVVDAQRAILRSHITDEINQLGKDPLLDMMQRLLDRAKEMKDDRGYLQVCPVNSDLNNLMWRSSRKLHHQIHQANAAGYHWPENLHLMLEQRDYWDAEDVCWLIMRVTEYLNGQHDPKQPMTISYTLFGRST